MDSLRKKFAESPLYARVAPFVIFLALTFLQELGPAYKYWGYLLKTGVGAWLIWEMRPYVPELRWNLSWEGVSIGILIFAVWVGLDGFYPRFAEPKGWNPHEQFGQDSPAAWVCIVGRILGSSIVVPPLEEIFYRSFLYRYFIKINFLKVPLGFFHPLSFFVTSILFGLMHPDRWLAGILCGLAYQWLVVHKNRMGDAIVAHGITNFLLGVWIVWKGGAAWTFW